MMRKQRSLTPFMNEEFNTTEDNQDVVYWMLLYEAVMPVVFPVIIPFSRWKRNDYYIHHSPNHACAEIVLEGSMRYILDDQPVTVHANEMIILPIGLPNRVETGPDGFSRKVVFGLRGFLAEIILASWVVSHFAETGPAAPVHSAFAGAGMTFVHDKSPFLCGNIA